MDNIRNWNISIKPTFNNTSKSQTRTLHKMFELLEINNAIQKQAEAGKSVINKSEPQFLMFALLSAFVMTSRSVTNIMKKEYTHSNGFLEWYKTKVEIMKMDIDMKFFDKLRTEIFHTNTLSVDRNFIFTPSKPVEISNKTLLGSPLQYQQNGDFIVIDKQIRINDIPISDITVKAGLKYFFSVRKDKEARWLCVEHFQKLAKVTSECESKFTPIYSS